jgi:hypothetical protein
MYFVQYNIFSYMLPHIDSKAVGFAVSFAMFANKRDVLPQRGLNGL